MDPQVECSSLKAENQSRKRALIGIGLVLLPVPLALAGWVAWNSRDIPAPDVSDLTLQPRQLPAEQDAYAHFERAAAALVWPKDAAFLRLNAAPQPDDEARVRDVVATNGEALRHLKSGLACDACLGPQDWRFDATTAPFVRWQNLGRLLALRLFEKRTGKLPATLAELVPAYLPAVPRDPSDGNPFRYAPEKRLVYAVGMDLEDSGGTPTPPRKPGKKSKANPDEVFGLDAAGQENP